MLFRVFSPACLCRPCCSFLCLNGLLRRVYCGKKCIKKFAGESTLLGFSFQRFNKGGGRTNINEVFIRSRPHLSLRVHGYHLLTQRRFPRGLRLMPLERNYKYPRRAAMCVMRGILHLKTRRILAPKHRAQQACCRTHPCDVLHHAMFLISTHTLNASMLRRRKV